MYQTSKPKNPVNKILLIHELGPIILTKLALFRFLNICLFFVFFSRFGIELCSVTHFIYSLCLSFFLSNFFFYINLIIPSERHVSVVNIIVLFTALTATLRVCDKVFMITETHEQKKTSCLACDVFYLVTM